MDRGSDSMRLISEEDISGFNRKLSNRKISAKDLKDINNIVLQRRASNLKAIFKMPFVVDKFSPWDTLNELYDPSQKERDLSYEFSVSSDGVQYGAFVVTNINPSSQEFTFRVTNDDPGWLN